MIWSEVAVVKISIRSDFMPKNITNNKSFVHFQVLIDSFISYTDIYISAWSVFFDVLPLPNSLF